jgi:hypothetical protein
MKGIIITEFLELVEDKFDLATVDEMLKNSGYQTGFSGVETYDNKIIHEMTHSLGEITSMSPEELLEIYGEFMFKKFRHSYTHFIERANGLYDFLDSVESYIHIEVLKLYPNAELPYFETLEKEDGSFVMTYTSKRRMYSFAKGLIQGSIDHFDPKKSLTMRKISDDGSKVEFVVC